MGLTPSVAKVLKQVEETTGLPVHVQEDAALPQNILAKVTMARGEVLFHQIAYQTKASKAPDYLIVYQCGFILRRYRIPPNQRFDFVGTEQAQAIVQEWVLNNPKNPNLPRDKVPEFTTFLLSGLLNQLRSLPLGLRVDEWVLEAFPDLHNLQQQAVVRQLNDNTAVLRPEVQSMMPSKALALNGAMSAAFALFWSQKLNQPQVVLPYQAGGYLQKGQELYDLFNSIPPAPGEDVHLVDAWANHLGMKSWYEWKKEKD